MSKWRDSELVDPETLPLLREVALTRGLNNTILRMSAKIDVPGFWSNSSSSHRDSNNSGQGHPPSVNPGPQPSSCPSGRSLAVSLFARIGSIEVSNPVLSTILRSTMLLILRRAQCSRNERSFSAYTYHANQDNEDLNNPRTPFVVTRTY